MCRSQLSFARSLRLFVFVAWLLSAASAIGQTTSFTYQGRLSDGGATANGNYDLQFALFDNSSGGTQVGATQTVSTVSVSGGVFTVQLDFGASAFPGANRFLEISVRPTGGSSFTTLSPRQPINPTPYAIRSLNASSADTVTVNGVPGGSGNYIQNMTSPQSGSNFNISGDGTAAGTLTGNMVNAGVQYNIGGNRILSNAGTSNVFAGAGAGSANTGSNNTFFGTQTGTVNTTAGFNSFFGSQAGRSNTASNNSFFGSQAGFFNTVGAGNSFFGYLAGEANTTGNRNSFFGIGAGSGTISNSSVSDDSFFGAGVGQSILTGGDQNSFFGSSSGLSNTTGLGNSYFGYSSGLNNTTGHTNSFFGYSAGFNNSTGFNNTFIGENAGNSNTATQVNGSTAIGASAKVSCSSCIVLGDATDPSLSVGIGTSNPTFPTRLDVVVSGNGPNSIGVLGLNDTGIGVQGQSHGGVGVLGDTAAGISVYGRSFSQGSIALRASGSSWFAGDSTPLSSANTGSGPGIAIGSTPSIGYIFGFDYSANTSSILALNHPGGNVGIGTIAPARTLDVNGRARVESIPLEASSLSVCFNGAGDLLQCGASSLRWKTNVRPFLGGLDIVQRLRPITFNWKEGGRPDIGLGAEDVAKVAPAFTFTNDKGEVEGVKYERLDLLLINAVKEQQAQIEQQREQLKQQQAVIAQQALLVDGLRRMVCRRNPNATLCRH